MKLSTIAVSVVAVLGVASVGGSYFTGKYAEAEYLNFVAQSNAALQKGTQDLGFSAQIKNVQFTRHFFTSEVRYDLELRSNEQSSTTLKGDGTLYHGLFPFNRVKSANFLPALASYDGKLTLPAEAKSWVENADGVLLTLQSSVGLSGKVSALLKNSAVHFNEAGQQIDLAPSVFDLENNGQAGKITIPSAKLILPNSLYLELEALESQFNQAQNTDYPQLNNRQIHSTAKRVQLMSSGKGGDPQFDAVGVIFENAQTDEDSQVKGEDYVSKNQLDGQFFVVKDKEKANVGNLDLSLEMAFNAKSANDGLQKWANMRQSNNLAMAGNFFGALGQQLKMKLDLALTDQEKHQSQVALDLDLDKTKAENNRNLEGTLKTLKDSTLKMDVENAYLKNLIGEFVMKFAEDKSDNAYLASRAEREYRQLLTQAKGSQFFDVDEKNIKLHLATKEGKAFLNGKEMSEQTLQSVAFMLMLGLSGL